MEVQINDEELTFLTESSYPYDDNIVSEKLFHPKIKLLLVTEGEKGCSYFTQVISSYI